MIRNEPIEVRVTRVIAGMLGIETDLPPTASFADLGADSLDMVELQSALQCEFDVKVTIFQMASAPTVGGLIALMKNLSIHSPDPDLQPPDLRPLPSPAP